AHQVGGLRVARAQCDEIIAAPRFCPRKSVHPLARSRLEYHGKTAIESRKVIAAARMIAQGMIDPERGGARISQPLVMRPPRRFPRRNRDAIERREGGMMLRHEAQLGIASRDENPS